MEQTTKNKIGIFIYTLLFGVLFFLSWNRYTELWERVIMLTVGAISILLYINYINSIKYFTLLDDILITRQTFSKQKKYSLKEVSSWTENHYSLFGYKTGKEIVIKTKSGTKIYLFQKNSKDFGNLSDYLNTNLSDIYKKSL